MLYLTDSNGVRTTGITLDYRESGGDTGVLVTLTARAYEDDTMLIGRFMSASLVWNDGTGYSESFPATSLNNYPEGYWEITSSKVLAPGHYVSVLTVRNFRSPIEDTARMNFFVNVVASKPAYNPPNLIYGPILPRDAGFPNSKQWSFDLGTDLGILESSVKMLLLTQKGDRIMVPNYGTNIRKILFEVNLPSTESLIREEIVSAFAQWEPRVELQAMEVVQDRNGRSVTINMTLVSKLNKQPFEAAVRYNR